MRTLAVGKERTLFPGNKCPASDLRELIKEAVNTGPFVVRMVEGDAINIKLVAYHEFAGYAP